jgi:hypothetical protein
MKRALLHSVEPGRICQVINPSEEFEVNPAFSWVDVPDDTTPADRWDVVNDQVIKYDVTRDPAFIEHGHKIARTIGYGAIGDQLDMLFKELRDTGTISNTGPWVTHIASIKSAIPKDNPQAVHEWNQSWAAAQTANVSTP